MFQGDRRVHGVAEVVRHDGVDGPDGAAEHGEEDDAPPQPAARVARPGGVGGARDGRVLGAVAPGHNQDRPKAHPAAAAFLRGSGGKDTL